MAPQVLGTPRDPAHERRRLIVDTTSLAPPGPPGRTDQERELFAAACEAMRLLQDRQAHTPEEMLDPRECKVLRQLRRAVGQAS
jgi:hypothetical protein